MLKVRSNSKLRTTVRMRSPATALSLRFDRLIAARAVPRVGWRRGQACRDVKKLAAAKRTRLLTDDELDRCSRRGAGNGRVEGGAQVGAHTDAHFHDAARRTRPACDNRAS